MQKIFFQADVLLQEVILVRIYAKQITEKKNSC